MISGVGSSDGGASGELILEGGFASSAAADAANLRHVRGVLFLFCNCLCMAVFLTVQEPLLQRFPSPTLVTVYSYVFGARPQQSGKPQTASHAQRRQRHTMLRSHSLCRFASPLFLPCSSSHVHRSAVSLLGSPQGFSLLCWAWGWGLGAAAGAF